MTWTSNVQIAGQLSKAAPAVAGFYRMLHMVHLGDSSNSIWHSFYNGSNWSPNVKIPNQLSKAPPALAAFNGKLHMVHLGDGSNHIWHSWFDGSNWSPNVQIPSQSSKASPALAVFNGRLHMVHLGDSSNNIWHSTFDGTNWTPNMKVPGQLSKASPALAEFNGRLHMVHLGDSSNNIWHSTFDGAVWAPNVKVPNQLSKSAPTLADFGGWLNIVHAGNGSNRLWYAQLDATGHWTANVPVPNQLSQAPSTIAPYAGRLHMVHIGDSSHRLWHSSSDGVLSIVRVGAKVLLDAAMNPIVPPATVTTWFNNMRDVYATLGFSVQLVNTETLNLPALRIVDVGDCVSGSTTSDQQTLFGNRNNLNANDLAVYFVMATTPAYNGCASHPNGQPGCVVIAGASGWTMAHECGHVLVLNHVDDNDRLMTGNGTFNITNPPPDLTYEEGVTMGESDFSAE